MKRNLRSPARAAFAYRMVGVRIVCLGLLSAHSISCMDSPSIHARAPLPPPAIEEATTRLNGRWVGQMHNGDHTSTWTVVFEGRSVAIQSPESHLPARAWMPALVQEDAIVLVTAHHEYLTESVLRFVSPNQFYLDDLPKVVFTRETGSQMNKDFVSP